MNEITTIGLDLAKHVFQVHGVDASGVTVVRKRLRRSEVLAFFTRLPRCLIGLEACATAHYWARELQAIGHEVRLMPAQYVKAYVKRNKNDAADAEAICEAVQRPTMRFVPVKTAEQQAALLLHRGRERLVRQRTALVNALRAHLAEYGVIAPLGLRNVARLIAIVRDEIDTRLPAPGAKQHASLPSSNGRTYLPAVRPISAPSREAALMGDFGKLLEEQIPLLRRYAGALTRGAPIADDLVQDCLIRAVAKQHLWQPGTDLRAWLFTILHNQHVNDIRRAVREENNVSIDEIAPVASVKAKAMDVLALRDLQAALGKLPAEQRQVILLIGL